MPTADRKHEDLCTALAFYAGLLDVEPMRLAESYDYCRAFIDALSPQQRARIGQPDEESIRRAMSALRSEFAEMS